MRDKRTAALLLLGLFAFTGFGFQRASGAQTVERPPIVGVAHIALYVSDMAQAEEFFGHVLGYAHFSLDKPEGALAYKVNDHQYIEVYPGLKSPDQDRL